MKTSHSSPKAVTPNVATVTYVLPKNLSKDAETALGAALLAAEKIKSMPVTSVKINEKTPLDYVCDIDFESNFIVKRTVGLLDPKTKVYSEEDKGGRLTPEMLTNAWVIDPLDGTSCLLFNGSRELPSVILNRFKNGECVLTLILHPFTGNCFVAEKGKGAYFMQPGKTDKIDFRKEKKINDRVLTKVIMNHYSDSEYETPVFHRAYKRMRSHDGASVVEVVPPNSGVTCRMAHDPFLSAVIHDNNPDNPKQEVWDSSGVQLWMKEAGGVAYALGKHPSEHNPFKTKPILMARTQEIADWIVKLIYEDKKK